MGEQFNGPIDIENKYNDEELLLETEDSQEYLNLVDEAYSWISTLTQETNLKYGIGDYERWELDEEKGLMKFYDNDILKLKVAYQLVGTFSFEAETWLWGYENGNILEYLTKGLLTIKDFGTKNNFERLYKRKWYANDGLSQEMMVISAYLLKAKGYYMIPSKDETLRSYIIFTDIEDLR